MMNKRKFIFLNTFSVLLILTFCSKSSYSQSNEKIYNLFNWIIEQSQLKDSSLFLFRQKEPSPFGTPLLVKYLKKEFGIKENELKNTLEIVRNNRSGTETSLLINLPIVTTLNYSQIIKEYYEKAISENNFENSRVIEFSNPLYLTGDIILVDILYYVYFPYGETTKMVIKKTESDDFVLLKSFTN